MDDDIYYYVMKYVRELILENDRLEDALERIAEDMPNDHGIEASLTRKHIAQKALEKKTDA